MLRFTRQNTTPENRTRLGERPPLAPGPGFDEVGANFSSGNVPGWLHLLGLSVEQYEVP